LTPLLSAPARRSEVLVDKALVAVVVSALASGVIFAVVLPCPNVFTPSRAVTATLSNRSEIRAEVRFRPLFSGGRSRGFGSWRRKVAEKVDSRGARRGGSRWFGVVAMSEGTLRLERVWSGLGIGGQGEVWQIEVDGQRVGMLADGEVAEVPVVPGRHTVRLRSGRYCSPERTFEFAEGETVDFTCHGPRFWPLMVASLIKPDLWISPHMG
jgi:hypothetical protein